MPVHITYFVHSTTTDNEAKRSSGSSDVELSEKGIAQAKELGKLTADKHFDAVFRSDMTRTKDTVELAWQDKYPVFVDKRLRECNYGDYDGESSDIVEPLQEQSIDTPFPNGESYEMVQKRIDNFLTELVRDYDNKHVAIVAHKAPQLAIETLIQGKTWEQAFADDWRKTKAWQPGWKYELYPKITVTNEDDTETGFVYMWQAINQGLTRRASRVYVYNQSGQILVQQRSKHILKPLLLDSSAAGHVDAGESYEHTAYKELEEELGISGYELELVADSVRTTSFYNNIYKTIVPDDIEINFDPHEVNDMIWYDPHTLTEEMKSNPEKFNPEFLDGWFSHQ